RRAARAPARPACRGAQPDGARVLGTADGGGRMALTAVRDSPGVSLRACVEAAFTPFDWARVPDARALPPDAEAHRLLQSWERLVEGRGGPGAFERRLALHGLHRAGALARL